MLVLALGALQTEDNLLGGLGLLVEDGLGLATVAGLLAVVAALTLGKDGGLAGLVLGDLVHGVAAALLAGAQRATSLRNVDLQIGSGRRGSTRRQRKGGEQRDSRRQRKGKRWMDAGGADARGQGLEGAYHFQSWRMTGVG